MQINKISKCKPLDNLELAQWLKRTLQIEASKSPASFEPSRLSLGGVRKDKPKETFRLSSTPPALLKQDIEKTEAPVSRTL